MPNLSARHLSSLSDHRSHRSGTTPYIMRRRKKTKSPATKASPHVNGVPGGRALAILMNIKGSTPVTRIEKMKAVTVGFVSFSVAPDLSLVVAREPAHMLPG